MIHRFSEREILAGLPREVREQFLQLDPAERRFLLTAGERERDAYQALPPDLQTRFARLPAAQRETWIALRTSEREFAQTLDETRLCAFLSLAPEDRRAEVARSPLAARERARVAALFLRADTLLAEVVKALSPWLDAERGSLEKARAVAFNQLREGRAEAQARRAAMRELLSLPGPLAVLEEELAQKVGARAVLRARTALPAWIAEAAERAEGRDDVLEALGRRLAPLAERDAPEPRVASWLLSGLRCATVRG